MNILRNDLNINLHTDLNKKLNLNPQQHAFINLFIDTLNPTESAEKAGYKREDASRRAKELLQSPKILDAINDKITFDAQNFTFHKAFFAQKLFEIIQTTTRQEEVLDKTGAPTGKFKLNDAAVALRALDALARCCSATHASDADKTEPEALQVLCIENLNDAKI